MKDIIDLQNSRDTESLALDSVSGLTERELTYFESEMVDFDERELVARRILTVNDDANNYDKTIEYKEETDVDYRDEDDPDNQDFNNPRETELQMIDSEVDEKTNPLFRRLLGAMLKWHEVEAARDTGNIENIDTNAPTKLRRGHMRFEDRIVFLGATAWGVDGLATSSDVQTTSPIDSTGSGDTLWTDSGKTPEDIVRDMFDAIEQLDNENGKEPPYNMALPQDRYSLIDNTFVALDQGSELTLLDLVRNATQDNGEPKINTIVNTPLLEDTNGSGRHDVLVMDPDEDNVDIITPEDPVMLPDRPQDNEDVLLRSRFVTGGARFKDGNGVVRLENI